MTGVEWHSNRTARMSVILDTPLATQITNLRLISSEIVTGCRTAIGAILRAARYLISDGPNAIGVVGSGINRRGVATVSR